MVSGTVIPWGLSLPQASGILLGLFTVGAACNAGRAVLMKLAGAPPDPPPPPPSLVGLGHG
jgi:hypothetical protein